jgi:hypothetical protein
MAEHSAVLLEHSMDLVPIQFLPHRALAKHVSLPRSDMHLTVYLHELRVSVVRIMVSHRWLKPNYNLHLAHPDGPDNPKHALLCVLCERLERHGWIRNYDTISVVHWLDFACINQDHPNPAQQLNGSLGQIIGSCDMMVSPMYDPDWRDWSSGKVTEACDDVLVGAFRSKKTSFKVNQIKDVFTDYRSKPFREYLTRGWCRLEMFFNANIPFNAGRAKLFGGELRKVMVEEKRRPHLLFGTREKELGEMPIILCAVLDEEFGAFHPGEGCVTCKDDKIILDAYVEELFKFNIRLKGHTETSLFSACRMGNLQRAIVLLHAGANIMAVDPYGWGSCLHFACENGHLEVVKYLCKHGGEELMMLANGHGESCLFPACEKGHLEVVKYLCECGGKVLLNSNNSRGESCLFTACERGRLEVVKYLSECGGEDLLLSTKKMVNHAFSPPAGKAISELWSICMSAVVRSCS